MHVEFAAIWRRQLGEGLLVAGASTVKQHLGHILILSSWYLRV